VELVGRPVAPFGGWVTKPERVGAVFGLLSPLLGAIAPVFRVIPTLFGFLAAQLGSVTELFGSVAVVLVVGSDEGIPVSAAKLLAGWCRAELRRRELAEVRR
jgi:hypothetical protein